MVDEVNLESPSIWAPAEPIQEENAPDTGGEAIPPPAEETTQAPENPCAGCGGQCCQSFSLKYSPEEFKAFYEAKLKGKRAISVNGTFIYPPPVSIEDLGIIVSQFELIGRGKKNPAFPQLEYQEEQYFYRCRLLDKDGTCSIHDKRPQLCKDFDPSADGRYAVYPNCKLVPQKPSNEELLRQDVEQLRLDLQQTEEFLKKQKESHEGELILLRAELKNGEQRISEMSRDLRNERNLTSDLRVRLSRTLKELTASRTELEDFKKVMIGSESAIDALKVSRKAIDRWGIRAQWDMVQEECGELIVAVSHYQRGRDKSGAGLVEEVVDVYIMICQAVAMIGENSFTEMLKKKIARLEKRIQEG